MNFKKQLSGIWYAWNQNKIAYVSSSLCGRQLTTTKGTVRLKPDQDDAWFFELAKHHQIIFDIGANVGYTALLATIQDPNRVYLLVDPNPKALAQANVNLLENNLGFKALYYSAFVSNKLDEDMTFYTIGAGAAGSMYPEHAKSAAAVNSFKVVKTVTLDFLHMYYAIDPDLVKIDVEGAEALVMQGATHLAKKTQCLFFIEMHAVEGLTMQENGRKILDWCQQNEYKAWYLKTGQILQDSETIKQRGKCHLLLIPEDEPYPDYLTGIAERADLPSHI
ncbi:FkbM family methyltransferase [Bizionia hallyeonensis]|uniref:FkbM family methyltransferase n=1 Tax=Bizionia hallyeonensis TaxID=1123757 RepID=A0ABW0C5K4_9FLAO